MISLSHVDSTGFQSDLDIYMLALLLKIAFTLGSV